MGVPFRGLRARLLVLASALALAIAIVLGGVHTPPARARVGAWLTERLRTQAGITAEIGNLSYNLFSLTARLSDVRLTSNDARLPFLAADRLEIDLPWRAIAGAFRIDAIDVEGLRLTLSRDANGVLNLPESTNSPASSTLMRLPIGRLRLANVDVRYEDAANRILLEMTGATLGLTRQDADSIAGPLTVARGPRVRVGDVTLESSLAGALSYDGRSIAFQPLTLDGPLGRVSVDGSMAVFGDAPGMRGTIAGLLALADTSRALSLSPPLTGALTLTGEIDGPLLSPTASLTATSPSVGWRQLSLDDILVRISASTAAVSLDESHARLGEGTLAATGRVALDSLEAATDIRAAHVALDPLIAAAGDGLPRLGTSASATIAGRAELSRGLSSLDATGSMTFAPVTPTPAGAMGVDGNLEWQVRDGRWSGRTALRVAGAVELTGNLGGRIDIGAAGPRGTMETLRGTTVEGRLRLDAPDLQPVWRRVNAPRGGSPAVALPVTGHAGMDLVVRGTVAEPAATGALRIGELQYGDVGPIDATAKVLADRQRGRLDDLQLRLGGNRLDGGAELTLATGRLRGRFHATVDDFVPLGASAARWRPKGHLDATLVLAGSRHRPVVTVDATGARLQAAGQPAVDLTGVITYQGDRLTLKSLELAQPDAGHVRASGRYAFASGQHELTLVADRYRISPIALDGTSWPASATMSGGITSAGPLDRLEGGGHFELTEPEWNGARIDRIDADVRLGAQGITLLTSAPALAFTSQAVVIPRAPYPITVTAGATNTSVGALLHALGERAPPQLAGLDGVVSARLNASGELDRPAGLSAALALLRLELQRDAARLTLDEPATAQYAGSRLHIDRIGLRTGDTTLTIAGEIAPPPLDTGSAVVGTLTGSLSDLRPWLAVADAPSSLGLDGAMETRLEAAGTLDAIRLTGRAQLDAAHVQWPGYPAITNLSTRMTLDGDVVEVPALEARWQEVDASGQLRVPLRVLERWLPATIVAGLRSGGSAATARGRFAHLTPAVAAPFVDPATLAALEGEGQVSFSLEAAQPSLEGVRGSLRIDDLTASAVNVPVAQRRPTEFSLADGRLQVVDWSWDVAGGTVDVSGAAELTGARAIDARVDGRLDLRVLGLFAPTVTTGGTGDLAVTVRGTADAPRADGTIRIENGEVRLSNPQIGVSGTTGSIALGPERVEITRFDGNVNGGRFSIGGGVEYRGLAIVGGTLTLDADGVALDVPAGVRTEVAARLRAALGERVAVSGRVEVARGAYRDPISLAALVAGAARAGQPTVTSAGEMPWANRIDLDVAVASADDLLVDNNYGRMDLGMNVRLVGTAAAPSVVGRAEIREGGVLYLGGRTYLVERGVIDFTDPRTIVPELDLSARTRVRGTDETNAPTDYDITLGVVGTPQRIETTMTSDPPRGQADIVSLLATGRLADQAGGAGTAVARDQVLGYLSGEALGFAARAVGLDTLRFEQGANVDALQADPSIAGEVNPAQRLTLSRRVSRFVDVTVSQNLRDTGLFTWIVAWTPRRAVEVRTVSRDDRSRSYELRHDVSFGGPAASRTTRAVDTPARVTAVQFTGHPTLPVDDLRGGLSVREGDTFDFYRWQQDRDRVRRRLLDRGFFEARVSARQVRDGSGVGLEYAIESGPRTKLAVVGYRLPARVVRELEDIWSNAIVLIALDEDLRAATGRALAADGYLRPSIHVSRQVDGDGSVTMQVGVEAGGRTERRSIRVTGNAQLPTATIEAVIDRLGLDAWRAPKAIADDLTEEYGRMGLLAARVSAGPIEFDGPAAVLPVRIDEGPTFVVGQITMEGAIARPVEAVSADFDLQPGHPYVPDDIERGRRAVREAYARAGYNAMREETTTVVDRARGAVDVHVRVEEGPRQVIERIAIAGADDVATQVVAGALATVAPGTAVDLDALNASRRRLLQTGLFRSIDFTSVPATAAVSGDEPVRLDVTVVRRTPWRLRYGVDVTDEDAPIAEQGRRLGGGINANLERFGLFGYPGTAGLTLRYNTDRRLARGVITWPSLFGRALASRLYLSRSRDSVSGENILAFVTDRSVITAEQRFRPFGRAQVAYAYQFELNHVFDPSPDPDDPFALDERWRQARLTASFVLDTRSDAIDPTRGQLHSSNVEYGLEVLGRNGRFLKYSGQEFLFSEPLRRWMPGVVSASGVRISAGRGFGGQDLILSERFYAGGANTVRGYPEEALGGVDVFGDPVPGQATLVLNQEIRFPVYRWLRGVGFLDAGDVFRKASDLTLRGLEVGAGFGLRFTTPVGLLRLDLGTPLPRHERPLKWTFSFGHIF